MTLADQVAQFILQARAYQERHGARSFSHPLRRLEQAATELRREGPPPGSLAQVLTFSARRRREEREGPEPLPAAER